MQLWRYGFAIERLDKRYRLIRPLGSGGMADVCLAVDEQKNDEVAVKVLRPDQLDTKLLGRFRKEASLIADWNHPNIIHVYGEVEWDVLDNEKGIFLPYIVMEYIRGGNLKERLTPDQPYPFSKTVHLFTQVCSAVQYAHEHGIIHRDIKPENILFRQPRGGSEDVVLSDFGMAVSLSATHHTYSHGGTPSYMAPEQLRGQAQSASDIYSLGVLLYRLCTGQLPFESQFAQILYSSQPPPNPSSINTALPRALDEIILTALSVNPVQRFSSAQVFSESLQNVANSLSFRPPSPKKSEQITDPGMSIKTVQPPPPFPKTKEVDEVNKSKAVNNGSPVANDALTQASLEKGVPQNELLDTAGSQEKVSPFLEGKSKIFDKEVAVSPSGQVSPPPATPITNAPEPLEEEGGADPGIIDLRPVPRGGGRSTVDLKGNAAAGAVPGARPTEPPASRGAARGGAGAAGAGAVAAAGPVPAGAPTAASGGANALGAVAGTPRPAGGVVPSLHSTPPDREQRVSAEPRRGRVLLLLFLVLLILFASGLAYAFIDPGVLLRSHTRSTLNAITITPDSKEVQDSYVMQAVTNQPNADQLQVSMRNLDVAPDAQSKTVTGTGRGQIAAVTAKGKLTFINGTFAPYTIGSGTVVTAANGVSVVTEQPAAIPAAVPGGANGSISVSAHAVNAGTAGNLDQGSINKICCSAGSSIFVKNDVAFAGGIDPKSYTFVQQGDVDAVATPLENTASQQANTLFKQQLKPNEKLVVGPDCKPAMQIPAGTVGDQGHAIASTTVTVTAKCTGAAYDRGAALAIAKDRLQRKANLDPGQGYVLVGDIVPDVTVSKVNADSVSLVVKARGIWAYQFDSAKQQELARQLAGKKMTDAQRLLSGQHGLANVKIDMQTKDDTLPTDPTQITFNVQKVQGENDGNTNNNTNGSSTTDPGKG